MNPVSQDTDYSQITTLVPVINEYLKRKGDPTVLVGGCRAFVKSHAVKSLKGKEEEHFHLLKQICTEKLEGISKDVGLQNFCDYVTNMQVKPRHVNLKELDKDENFYSSYRFSAPYPFNSETGTHDHLAKFLKMTASISRATMKYFILRTGDHFLGIKVEQFSFKFYDPNNRFLPVPIALKDEIPVEEFAPIVSHLLIYSEKKLLPLAIEILTSKDIRSEMNACAELKELQKEILKTEPNQLGVVGGTPFSIAIKERFFDAAKELRAHGANPDLIIGDRRPVMIDAVIDDDTEAVKELEKMGADLNICWNGKTPLWVAALQGSLDSVRLLLELGAKVVKDIRGISPQKAAWSRVQILRRNEAKAKITFTNNDRFKNFEEIIRLLNEAEPCLSCTEPLYELTYSEAGEIITPPENVSE